MLKKKTVIIYRQAAPSNRDLVSQNEILGNCYSVKVFAGFLVAQKHDEMTFKKEKLAERSRACMDGLMRRMNKY